jgi:hypothetical protein
MSKLDNFTEAFRVGGIGETETCACGKEHKEARRIMLDGKEYVLECDCWQDKAKAIMRFIDSNSVGIAEYLNNERARKIEEAKNMPTIEVVS